MKKRQVIVCAAALVLICLFVCFAAPILFQFPVIGRVYGAENEFMEIGGVVYERVTSHPYTSLDRGNYIGAVKNEAITMRIFEVKGVGNRQYLHAQWEWEGYFYRQQSE